jgi:hypothetical protein
MLKELRLFKIYSTVTTVLIAVLALSAFRAERKTTKFDEVDVERINVVEKDGRLRLVISNADRFPDPVMNGKTFHRQGDKAPGLIFYNGQGDENGGLIFGSDIHGKNYSAGAALLFDQFNQDQTVGMMYQEDNGRRTAGFRVWDRPDIPLSEMAEKFEAVQTMPEGPQKQEAMKKLEEAEKRGDFGAGRVFVGKNEDKEAQVILSDAQGRPRLRLAVSASGEPKLEFLDGNGKVTSSLPK